jgi:hypothetical protein
LRVAIPDAVLIQFYVLRMSKILLETCRLILTEKYGVFFASDVLHVEHSLVL